MRFLDKHNVIVVIPPVNLATAANSGDWISLKNFRRCCFLIIGAVGIAAEDIVATVRQAQAVAGTGAKDLATVTRIHQKEAVDIQTIGTFTKVTQAAAATFTSAVGGESQNLYAIEVDAEELDVAGGFDCVTLNIADTGTTAKLGCVVAILSEPRGSANVNAIAN